MSLNLQADGNSPDIPWLGGIRKPIGNFSAEGTFGSGTLKLQHKPVGGSVFVDVGDDVSFTSDGMGSFRLPTGTLRVNLAGSTNPDVNFDVTES